MHQKLRLFVAILCLVSSTFAAAGTGDGLRFTASRVARLAEKAQKLDRLAADPTLSSDAREGLKFRQGKVRQRLRALLRSDLTRSLGAPSQIEEYIRTMGSQPPRTADALAEAAAVALHGGRWASYGALGGFIATSALALAGIGEFDGTLLALAAPLAIIAGTKAYARYGKGSDLWRVGADVLGKPVAGALGAVGVVADVAHQAAQGQMEVSHFVADAAGVGMLGISGAMAAYAGATHLDDVIRRDEEGYLLSVRFWELVEEEHQRLFGANSEEASFMAVWNIRAMVAGIAKAEFCSRRLALEAMSMQPAVLAFP